MSNLVPVGDDQKQHLEITRDIAQKFNNDFGKVNENEFFPLPEPMILPVASRVMSLRDGVKKMSKSDSSEMTRIEFSDENDLIMKKIAKAKTDPLPMPTVTEELNERPEINNLINIYCAFSGEKIEGVINKFEGKKLSEFKNDLCDVVINEMEPIRLRFKELKNDKTYLKKILHDGMLKAKEKSDPIINEVKSIVGLG